ncbi:hypothetical protein [Clostridium sp.]|uniref:hypothetical protein n=1 Tax=Clostridium sp. TaxID=1506 RepID=UPI002FDE1E44
MRFDKVWEVFKLLCKFFERNVLSLGILKNKLFRVIVAGILILLIFSISMMVYMFFKNTDSSIGQTSIVLDIYSCTIVMWTYIIFLFMKILFIKKDSFTRFTQQLPVTHKEKNTAVLVFEVCMSLLAVNIIASSVVFALIARYGFVLGFRIICDIYFMNVASYLVLELLYRLILWILDVLKIVRMRSAIIICFLSAILVLIYSIFYIRIVDMLLLNYADKKGTSILLIFTYLMDKYSFALSVTFFLCVITILCILIVIIPNNMNSSTNLFLRLGKSKRITMLHGYFLNISRRIDTYNYLFIITFVYILSVICNVSKAYYLVLVLAVNGVYTYVQTDDLRILLVQKKYSIVSDYVYLILSQTIYMSIVAVPFIIVSCICGDDFISSLLLFPLILLSVIMFTLVGIVFPPKRENPFSVFIGFITVTMIFMAMFSVCFILSLGTFGKALVLFFVTIITIYYSILGLNNLRREVRYEKK